MIKQLIRNFLGIREGEYKISLFMMGYIFLIINVLLIIKSTINALFLIELGADSLPIAYLLVAIAAIAISYLYNRLTNLFPLDKIIRFTLSISILVLLLLVGLLYFQALSGLWLYFFYVGVAIYAVLATSQFWVLANLVFNAREAKRLFSIIGAGAITGGIVGGYMATFLASVLGNESLIFVAAVLLCFCFPLLTFIWDSRVSKLNNFKQQKRLLPKAEHPFQLIRSSKHLSYLAGIIAVGVVTARLIDFQFSDIASKKITDSEELTAFFGFWLSSFNLLSLLIQLFITRRIVGVWGVGFSLLLLPAIVLFGAVVFLIFPELGIIILMKATDASLKQSVNKSAVELLALPIPFQLKHKTKSFIDVVVDSLATGFSGCLLIFFIKGLGLPDYYITLLIIALSLIWIYFVAQVRKQYFLSFLNNLDKVNPKGNKKLKEVSRESFLEGMKDVFENGTEQEILFMLGKTKEINDSRFAEDIRKLLQHPSDKVKAEAIRNLYFMNSATIDMDAVDLLNSNDHNVVLATLEYLLDHASNYESSIFDLYLNHEKKSIATAALISLAKEARTNPALKEKYELGTRIQQKAQQIEELSPELSTQEFEELMLIVGYADYQAGYDFILQGLGSDSEGTVKKAIQAASYTLNPLFIDSILELLPQKVFREDATKALLFYGNGIIRTLSKKIMHTATPLPTSRMLPTIIAKLQNQEAVLALFSALTEAEDLTVRLECIRSLTFLQSETTALNFNKQLVAKIILEECQLYHQTLNAMHTQILVHYTKRKKFKVAVSDKETDARKSLMELLENRLDAGLERIFKLLELKYKPIDVQTVYNGLLSEEQEKRHNAIEFLDSILNPKLRGTLIPIVESSVLDTTSEEVIERIGKSRLSEYHCFQSILDGKDLKLKLAVLYLIEQQADIKYLTLVESQIIKENMKLETFAENAQKAILQNQK